jgi:hypothetical protein
VLHACPEEHPHVLHKSVSVPDDVQYFGFVAEHVFTVVPSLHGKGAANKHSCCELPPPLQESSVTS